MVKTGKVRERGNIMEVAIVGGVVLTIILFCLATYVAGAFRSQS